MIKCTVFQRLSRAAAFAAVACATGPVLAAAPKVVVTIKPIHSLVAGVMAGAGGAVLLVEGSASPHTFTLKPSGASAINAADVFIRVSEGLEPFTSKITQSLPANVKLLTLVDAPGVVVLDQRQGQTFEAHTGHDEPAGADDHDHAGAHDAKDAHIWLDPENAKAIVAHVAKTLAGLDAANAATYTANAAHMTANIDTLSAEIAATLKPVSGKPFVVFHDAYQYFEKRFGLAARGSVTVSPDVPPSARRLTDVRNKILELGAVCVFAEPVFQPKLVAAVTEGTNARPGTLDPEGMTLDAGPDLYAGLMRGLARSLSTCLAPAG